MNNTTQQRATLDVIEANVPNVGNAENSLTDARAEMDRLFALASKSFESIVDGDSQEFLRRSRQTGGQ
jgi:hypothetical protein